MARRYETRVAVIGSGAAGMMAALAVAKTCPVLLITDRKLGRSNSLMAQGGLQVPPDDAAERDAMVEDMLASSRGRSSRERVQAFVSNIAPAIDVLTAIGVDFDRAPDGTLLRRLAGGLSRPRIISSKDQIGPKIMTALRKAVLDRNIPVLEFSAVTDITHAGTAGQRTWTLTIETGAEDARPQPGPKETGSVVAEAVVCAAGGGTYAHALKLGEATTNPANSNEKIYRLLERLGLKESDRDLFQYQPFGIVRPLQGRGRCVPETITNFNIDIRDRSGALICNTRQDRLSMVAAMKAAHGAGRSYLFDDGDWAFAMGIPQDSLAQIRQAFPKLEGILREDSSTIYVRPILHYYLGGFPVGISGETEIEGLYLAGEITTGLHGVNRLMGAGLLDSLVGGMVAGRHAASQLTGRRQDS